MIPLETSRENVTLRPLSLDDAEAYFQAVDEDRAHLSQFGEPTADNYPTVGEVEHSIINPSDPTKQRYGIWDGDVFAGSINLRSYPEDNSAEIGYWLRKSATGKGLAQAAAQALALSASGNYERVFAIVDIDNTASSNVLVNAGFMKTEEDLRRATYDFAR